MTAEQSPIFEAWCQATEAVTRCDSSVRRQFLHWIMSRIAVDGLTDREALLTAARRAVPQSSLKV